jgi:hypothetical protein
MRDSYSYTIEEHKQYGKVYVIRIHPNLWGDFQSYMKELDIELEKVENENFI